MEIFLVRHGDAVSEAVDPQRPLSSAGRQQVTQVARLAASKKLRVATIYHSGILRAQQTAEIFNAHLSPPGGIQSRSGLLPQDDPMIAKAELEMAGDPVMLVGHLPHMGSLASLLIRGDPDIEVVRFAPATLVCCSGDGLVWQIAWVLTPELT